MWIRGHSLISWFISHALFRSLRFPPVSIPLLPFSPFGLVFFFITRYSPFMNVTAYRVCVALCLFHNGYRHYGFAIVDDHRPPYNFSSFYLLRFRLRSPFRHLFPFNASRQPCIFTPVLAMYALKNVIERGNLFEWYCRDEHTYTPDRGLVNYLCTLKRTRNTPGLERKRVPR